MMTATEMGGILKEDARKAEQDCKCGVTISDVAVVQELASHQDLTRTLCYDIATDNKTRVWHI